MGYEHEFIILVPKMATTNLIQPDLCNNHDTRTFIMVKAWLVYVNVSVKLVSISVKHRTVQIVYLLCKTNLHCCKI